MPIFEDNDRVFDERLAASSRQDRAASERLIKQAVDAATRTLEEWHIEPIAEALDARIPKIEAAGQRWQWWYDALRPRDLRAAGCIVLNPDVPWRFTMLIDQPYRDAIVQALRAAGFDAGTNYPNLARSFPKLLGDQRHADADSWAARVMQLWLTDDYDQARIRRGADIVRQAVDQLFAAKKGSPT